MLLPLRRADLIRADMPWTFFRVMSNCTNGKPAPRRLIRARQMLKVNACGAHINTFLCFVKFPISLFYQEYECVRFATNQAMRPNLL
jgi:hypothetical protein